MKIGVEIISNTIYKMVRTNKLGIVATLVAAAVAFSSCTKDENADGIKVGGSGKGIAFTSMLGGSNSTATKAASGATIAEHYEIAAEFADGTISDELFTIEILPNDGSYDSYDAATKTVYGEDYKEGGRVTRSTIHWEVGDLITIYSNQAKIGSYNNINRTATSNPINSDTACYKITSNTLFENFKYKGKIEPVENGNGLWWGENTQDHYFIGSYPAIKQVAGSYTKGGTPANSSITLFGLNYSVKQSDGSFTQDVVLDGSKANQYNPELTKYGYMYAGTKVAKENVPASTVNLEFTPNFTAYEFNLTNDKLTGAGESIILKNVTIESAQDLAAEGVSTVLQFDGSDNFSFYSQLPTTATDKSKKIFINFKNSDGTDALPITLPTGGNYLKFTILTLGKTSSGYQTDVKIKFEMEYNESKVDTSGTDKIHRIMTLTLKDGTSNMQVPEGKKVVIKNGKMTTGFSTLSTDVDAIVFAKSDEDVNGYSKKPIKITSERRADGTLEPWEIFALVNGSEIAYGTADWPEWIRLDKNKSDGTNVTQVDTIRINPGAIDRATATITSPAAGFITELKNATPIGNESTPRDLSLYDIYGVEYGSATSKVTSITTSGSHTANCYVVSAPGCYSFPLVYGNAVGYTATNSDDAALKKTYTGYKNANNKDISSPYILTDLGITDATELEAVVVWQDVYPGAEVILDKELSIIDAPSGAGLSCEYIQFRIQQENILPCNAIIALREKSTEKILWSWHIWVVPINSKSTTSTDYYNWNNIFDFKYISTSNAEVNAKMLNSNLGWCPPIKYSGNTKARSITLRVRHTGTEDTYKDVTITQDSYAVNSEGEFFSSTFYQWGRKDPFIGYYGETTGKIDKPFSSISGYEIYIKNIATDTPPTTLRLKNEGYATNIGQWIKNPNIYNSSVGYVTNNWNSDQTDYLIRDAPGWWNKTIKTIYDPSPAGFCVPPARFGTAFVSGYYHSWSNADGVVVDVYGETKSREGAKPAGYLFSNDRTTSNYKLFFPKDLLRRSAGGRIVLTDVNVRYFTSVLYKTDKGNKAVVVFAPEVDTPRVNAVFDSSIHQNQSGPVRPVLEQ